MRRQRGILLRQAEGERKDAPGGGAVGRLQAGGELSLAADRLRARQAADDVRRIQLAPEGLVAALQAMEGAVGVGGGGGPPP